MPCTTARCHSLTVAIANRKAREMKMFCRSCCHLISVMACLTTGLAATPPSAIEEVGTLNTYASRPIAINNQGELLMAYRLDKQSREQFLVRDRFGNVSEIPHLVVNGGRVVWEHLTNISTVYGIAKEDRGAHLFRWHQDEGVVDLGLLPSDQVVGINDRGQVLIRQVTSKVNGESTWLPVIWEDGEITTLECLTGNTGMSSQAAYGLAINNNGDVVGTCNVISVHKNSRYSQWHATKWTNGHPEDLHYALPKTDHSEAIAISDEGEVILRDNDRYSPGDYLLGEDLTKLSNRCCTTTPDLTYSYDKANVYDQRGDRVISTAEASASMRADTDSIWLRVEQIKAVNDLGEVAVVARTIYGEQHALLLTMEPCGPSSEKDEMPPATDGQDQSTAHNPPSEKQTVSLAELIASARRNGMPRHRLLEEVKQAIAEGANVDDDSLNGHRPLHLAIQRGYEETALLLIDCGADVNFWDKSSLDPIHWAINLGEWKVAQRLIDSGAKLKRPIPDLKFKGHMYDKFVHFHMGKRN